MRRKAKRGGFDRINRERAEQAAIRREQQIDQIYDAAEKLPVTVHCVMRLCGISESMAYEVLAECRRRGLLTKVGKTHAVLDSREVLPPAKAAKWLYGKAA